MQRDAQHGQAAHAGQRVCRLARQVAAPEPQHAQRGRQLRAQHAQQPGLFQGKLLNLPRPATRGGVAAQLKVGERGGRRQAAAALVHLCSPQLSRLKGRHGGPVQAHFGQADAHAAQAAGSSSCLAAGGAAGHQLRRAAILLILAAAAPQLYLLQVWLQVKSRRQLGGSLHVLRARAMSAPSSSHSPRGRAGHPRTRAGARRARCKSSGSAAPASRTAPAALGEPRRRHARALRRSAPARRGGAAAPGGPASRRRCPGS